ncbi:MAG: hypothetical protein ACTSWP_07785 [Candidatus Freyarchaeota archaeon]|nr:hypothetical protein [Candidatus Freyrarchaeum guaymaensis]
MNITKSLAASTVVFQRRWKKGSALENFMSDIHVDEWRIYWRGLRYAFIAETIPGMLCKEMMSMLGFLSKSYFFPLPSNPRLHHGKQAHGGRLFSKGGT